MRVLRQPALGEGYLQRCADRRTSHGSAEFREVDQVHRAPESRTCLCRGDHLAPSGSNLTFESRLGFPSDLPNMVVGLQAAINRFVGEANVDPKPFAWLADPNKSIFAVRRGYQVLDSIH